MAAQLKSPVQLIPEKIQTLLDENKLLTQELRVFRKGNLKQLLEKCLLHKEKAGSIELIAMEIAIDSEEMSEFANDLIHQMRSGVVALGATVGERCQLLIAVSPDLVAKQINATSLIKEVAPLIQGGGGGKQNLAQAGGKDPHGLPKALDKIRNILANAS